MWNPRNALFLIAGSLVAIAILAGCTQRNASQPATDNQAADDWKTGLDEDTVAALSELSDADRSAALAQKVCPVTDERLGSMGKPLKVTVEGQDVFLCCDGCEEELKSEPAKYLAKLNAQ